MGFGKQMLLRSSGMTRFAAVVCLLAAAEWLPVSGYTIDDKIKLEQWYADRAKSIVEDVVGRGKARAFVHVYLETVQTQKSKDTYNVEASKAPWAPGKREQTKKEYVMPGFLADNPLPDPLAIPGKYEHLFEQQLELPETVIKKIDVALMVDDRVAGDKAKQLPELVMEALSMDQARGDAVTMRSLRFPPLPGLREEFSRPEIIVEIARLGIITALCFLGMMILFALLRVFLRDFAQIARAFSLKVNEQVRHEMVEGSIAPHPELGPIKKKEGELVESETAEEPGPKPVGTNRHFGFVTPANVGRLAFLLKNEPPERIAVVLPYLGPEESAFVLNTLALETHKAVVARLTSTFSTDPESVAVLEESLRTRIDYVLDGPELLLGLADTLDDAGREKLYHDIEQRDPAMARSIRDAVFLWDHVMFLTNKDLHKLLAPVSNEQLVVALQGMSDDFVGTLLAAKPEGAQKILRETIKLEQKHPPAEVLEARRALVAQARRLIRDRAIEFHKPERVDAYIIKPQ